MHVSIILGSMAFGSLGMSWLVISYSLLLSAHTMTQMSYWELYRQSKNILRIPDICRLDMPILLSEITVIMTHLRLHLVNLRRIDHYLADLPVESPSVFLIEFVFYLDILYIDLLLEASKQDRMWWWSVNCNDNVYLPKPSFKSVSIYVEPMLLLSL